MSPYYVRIVTLDSYMCPPIQGLDVMYSEFRGSAISQVPILRLFGSTETGKKICLHIHGIFPYFYIPYDGDGQVNSLMYQIAANIDKAINVSLNQTSSNAQHVYKISLVSGIPMYGYHSKKHQFLKIYLYNPLLIRRVSNLLMNDSTLGKLYQPHETHLPFALQFMIDYNLHGMSNVILSEMKFRMTPNNSNLDISPELMVPAGVKKRSVCEIEGDVLGEYILNRLEVASGNIGVNPGIATLWADEKQRRRNKSESSQIEHLLELKNINLEPTKSHLIFKQALLERIAIRSTEKDVAAEKLNLSVYPAETPDNLNIQNASLADSQGPSSLELSLNDTLTSMDVTDTIVSVPSDMLSETLDDEAENLLQILQNLEANAKDNTEEDSILSQMVKENEEDKDLDLSMPLEAITTPKKIIPSKDAEDSDDDDLLNRTLVPQLDGECDDDSEHYGEQLLINNGFNRTMTRSFKKFLNDISRKRQIEQKFVKKTLYIKLIKADLFRSLVKKGRDMPLLDEDLDETDYKNIPFRTDTFVEEVGHINDIKVANNNDVKSVVKDEHVVERIRSEQVFKKRTYKHKESFVYKQRITKMKSWEFQIKQTRRRDQIFKLMKRIHKKEHKMFVLLSKNNKPIFKIIPGVRRKAIKNVEINILSEIMLNTKNYVDPDLHLILQYPSMESFLYVYNTNIYPKVTEIPKQFINTEKEHELKTFISIMLIKYNSETNHQCLKQEKEVQTTENKSCVLIKKEIIKSTECLKNNSMPAVSNQPDKVLQNYNDNLKVNINRKNDILGQSKILQINNSTSKENTHVHFLREIIDSKNEKQCYIFSSKYLMNIRDNNMINNIENITEDHVKATIEYIKKELEKHISNLKEPICNINNGVVKEKNKENNPDNNVNTESYKNQSENTHLNVDESINSKNILMHGKKPKKRSFNKNCKCTSNENEETMHSVCLESVGEDFQKSSRNNLPKKCLFLDGAQDSSSSEDESSSTNHKRLAKKQSATNFLRYSALPVTVYSSPGQKNQEDSSDKQPVSESTITKREEKKAPINKHHSQLPVCDINVKRRLNFVNTSLQTTIIEEQLMCNYSPSKKRENVKSVLYTDETLKLQQQNELSSQRTEECTNKKTELKISNECFTKEYSENDPQINKDESGNDNASYISTDCSNSSHCDIFSNNDSDDEMNNSFFKSPEIANKLNSMLTAAQKYDKETNFNAKEGTSNVITPQSSLGSHTSSQEIQHSSESSSVGLITPYQHIKEETSGKTLQNENKTDLTNSQDQVLHINFSPSVINVTNCDTIPSRIFTPVRKAPTKQEVVNSLDKYKIPCIKQDVPFYSNIEDVTGSVEVGHNVLKIISKGTAHLPEFESQTDGINNFRKLKLQSMSSNLELKKSNINNLMLSFCKDRDCIIIPLKKPPSVAAVQKWIVEKSKKPVTPEKKTEKIKIFIPLSPDNNGGDDDNDLDMSLTISPCTPITSQSGSSQVMSSQTPKSSKLTDKSSSVSDTDSTTGKKRMKTSHSLRKSLFVSQDKSHANNSCQITGVSPNNTYGFNHSTENLQAARAVIEHQHLTVLVMELHIRTRGEFKPNPEHDAVCAIFYSVLNDVPANHPRPSKCKGIITVSSLPLNASASSLPLLDGAGVDCDVIYVDSEENLLNEFLKLIEYWDPDIFAGYEIQMLSWGYLIDRASILGINYKCLLSRIKEEKKYRDEDGQNELHITGRIILDVWRLMRHEIALQSYTFESIVYHILHKRVPQYPSKDLSFWWDHRSNLYRYRTVQYYLFRVETILDLFDKLDIIGRTSELARLFGIQFYEVLSRGSQFRVESMMLRLAKPLNFVPVSPSVQQRAVMKAPEYIPLVLEPESKLYNDPVIVLDFQSLYPSIIIAYNYCFTTCLGRVECLGKNTPFEFGASQLKVSRRYLEKLLKKDLINFSPCGASFVKKEVRDGILPRMLREILDTRLMVKNSMKENKQDRLLQKVLHNRQLGLKLIANVTYGYTAANFSGRMPSVEIADSVVSKGRETLQRAIEMVDGTSEWGARVVYGDTDSLFVLLPGKSRQHAFEIGKKIADAVTDANPDPVKLKLEKVYQPCILQTKKRYVGYMYESPDQKDPVYDAKGIETVRRDGCPAVSKMLEKCLRLLFETKDVSLVKKYVLRQFNKIIAGRASIQDLTFAKEYRGSSGYRPGACVPSLELARKWTAVDKRNEPRRGERVPYIIINGPPGLPLIRLVRSPRDLLSDPSLRPNALYYITKVIIPPINRCFNLIGADLNTWFNQMPRKQIQTLPSSVSPGKKSTISQYFSTTSCAACGEQTQTGICDICIGKPQTTSIILTEKLRSWERSNYDCNLICQSCTGTQTDIKCTSLDCPVLYRRIQTNRDVLQASYIRELISSNEFLF